MHYFVQGLREDLKRAVIMHKPKTFEEAESIARLKVSLESAIQDDRASSSTGSTDPEKAVLYKMLNSLTAAKSTPSDNVAAFSPSSESSFAQGLQ